MERFESSGQGEGRIRSDGVRVPVYGSGLSGFVLACDFKRKAANLQTLPHSTPLTPKVWQQCYPEALGIRSARRQGLNSKPWTAPIPDSQDLQSLKSRPSPKSYRTILETLTLIAITNCRSHRRIQIETLKSPRTRERSLEKFSKEPLVSKPSLLPRP